MGRTRLVLICFFAITTLVVIPAADGARLRFLNSEQLENAGISIPVPIGFRQDPLKSPRVTVYKVTRGQEKWTEERIPVIDLWTASQHVARWKDDSGNIIVLSKMTYDLPDSILLQDVRRDDYQSLVDEHGIQINAGTQASVITDWAKHHMGIAVAGAPAKLPINKSRLSVLIELPVAEKRAKFYAFRINKRFPGQMNAPENWFSLFILFGSEPDITYDRDVKNGILSKICGLSGKGSPRPFRTGKSRKSSENKELQTDPVRAAIHKSIESLDDWWHVDSEHYVLFSNDNRMEHRAEDILKMLEEARGYYMFLAPPSAASETRPGVVRLFATDEEYERYLLEDGIDSMTAAETAGLFSGRRRELLIRPVARGRGSAEPIIRHEAFHQYLSAAFPNTYTSPWFNEGAAVFFEGMKLKPGGKYTVEEVRRYSKWIKTELLKKDADLEKYLTELLFLDYPQFYAIPDISYPLSYAFMYYLQRGAPLKRNNPYANIIPDYLAELETSHDPVRATKTAFAKVNFKKLIADFRSFWLSAQLRHNAKSKLYGR